MEHSLGQHIKLFAERVHDHKEERNQRNYQPGTCKENGDRPCNSGFQLFLPVINLFSPLI